MKSSERKTKSVDVARSCLTCGHSKSKTALPSSSITVSPGLLSERCRSQLNSHQHELSIIIHNRIQSSDPPIRGFAEHSRESEKLIHKSLKLVCQPKFVSYEQIRNDLKTDHKQVFCLVDPIIDIVRDTLNHCDITQMREKINLDILNSNISQTANLYNNQTSLLTLEEHNALKSNQLSWLQQYLIDNESNKKKITRKQTKELNQILHRSLEALSTNQIFLWNELTLQLQREYPKAHDLCNRAVELVKESHKNGLFSLKKPPSEEKPRPSLLITEHARQNLQLHRTRIISSLKNLLINHNKLSNNEKQLENYLNKTFSYLEKQKSGQFKNYNDLKEQLKRDFAKDNQEKLIEQVVDVIEQAHATSQFDDIDKPEVQTLMKDRLDGKRMFYFLNFVYSFHLSFSFQALIIKEMYVSLPPRVGALKCSDEHSSRHLSTATDGDHTTKNATSSYPVVRGLSWREANERARILFYRGKHPAIHYDEKAAGFDVRMLLETASGDTQEIPVTDTEVRR